MVSKSILKKPKYIVPLTIVAITGIAGIAFGLYPAFKKSLSDPNKKNGVGSKGPDKPSSVLALFPPLAQVKDVGDLNDGVCQSLETLVNLSPQEKQAILDQVNPSPFSKLTDLFTNKMFKFLQKFALNTFTA